MDKKKLLLDMDAGIDDAMAIAYGCASDEVDLIGVTTAFGNVSNDTAVRNALDLLALFGRSDVPVFPGCDRPIGSDAPYAPSDVVVKIHGENGIGNVDLPHDALPSDIHSVDFILSAAEKYGKDLILVPTGALTNLAKAIERDIDTVKKIGKIVFMGGALTVEGNVSPYAEANMRSDPEAAKIVLESGINLTMVGLDVTLKALLQKEDVIDMAAVSPAGRALSEMICYYIDNEIDAVSCALHDPLAVAIALHPQLAFTHPFALTCITEGEAIGRTVARSFPADCKNPSVSVALAADPDFDRHLIDALTRMLQKLN